jgi:hypothetical protein
MMLEQALKLVQDFFKEEPEKYELWMKTDNPMLGGVSPEWMIAIGREHKLINFIVNSILENQYY